MTSEKSRVDGHWLYDERTFDSLGLDEIVGALGGYTRTPVGGEQVRSQRPVDTLAAAEILRDETSEMRFLLEENGGPPLGHIPRVDEWLDRTEKRAALSVEALLGVASVLRCGWLVGTFLAKHAANAPLLAEHGALIPECRFLFEELFGALDPETGIRDEASAELASLRAKQRGLHGRIRSKIESMRSSGVIKPHLQDDYVTIRDDRFVLPVQSGHKVEVPGIIHGNSQTGQTLYVEPQELVQLNNELKILGQAIAEEEQRILLDLSLQVASEADSVRLTSAKLADVDCVLARALLANQMEAKATVLTGKKVACLRKARNPHLTLRGIPVVPNDIELGPDFLCLVVSGPNAGGKTVTLNTIGVSCAMAALGCHLPMDPDSVVPVVTRIHAVMGDHQSLADDLSTFSGHIRHVNDVLEAVPLDRPALVLLDEIAVGTEAMQGAALAVAILEALVARGVMVVVTTHYQRLKMLAKADPGFRNAAVGLNPNTQAPTFSLVMGDAGASSPISIARRLGMNSDIVARADALCGGQALGLEAALAEAQSVRESMEQEKTALAEERIAMQGERKRLAEVRRRLEEEGQRMVLKAHQDALQSAREAQDEIARVVHELQKNPDSRQAAERRVAVRDIELQLAEQAQESQERLKEATTDDGPPSTVKEGDAIRVLSMGAEGVVVGLRGGRVEVNMGGLRTTVPVSDIRSIQQPAAGGPPAAERRSKPRVNPNAEATPDTLPPRSEGNTVDLRGMRVEEAIDQVEAFLDQGLLRGWAVAFLLHGHGTGKLKAGLRAWLPKSRYVERYEAAERSHGGDGVTIVWIR